MRAEKSRITGTAVEIERRVPCFEDQLSRRRRILDPQFDLADRLAPRAALEAQLLERPDPAFVASAPRLHALADPHFLLRELLVEQRRVLGLDVERRALLEHVVVVAGGPAREAAAIELDDARRKAPDQGAIVAHEQQCPAELEHGFLEPGDRIDVEMVRGLIQQQQVRRRDQRPAQHHAPPPAARERAQRRIGIELEPRDDPIYLQPRLPVPIRTRTREALGYDRAHGLIAVTR